MVILNNFLILATFCDFQFVKFAMFFTVKKISVFYSRHLILLRFSKFSTHPLNSFRTRECKNQCIKHSQIHTRFDSVDNIQFYLSFKISNTFSLFWLLYIRSSLYIGDQKCLKTDTYHFHDWKVIHRHMMFLIRVCTNWMTCKIWRKFN